MIIALWFTFFWEHKRRFFWKNVVTNSLVQLTSTVGSKISWTSIENWNVLSKWWQNCNFWVDYPFNGCLESTVYKACHGSCTFAQPYLLQRQICLKAAWPQNLSCISKHFHVTWIHPTPRLRHSCWDALPIKVCTHPTQRPTIHLNAINASSFPWTQQRSHAISGAVKTPQTGSFISSPCCLCSSWARGPILPC